MCFGLFRRKKGPGPAEVQPRPLAVPDTSDTSSFERKQYTPPAHIVKNTEQIKRKEAIREAQRRVAAVKISKQKGGRRGGGGGGGGRSTSGSGGYYAVYPGDYSGGGYSGGDSGGYSGGDCGGGSSGGDGGGGGGGGGDGGGC